MSNFFDHVDGVIPKFYRTQGHKRKKKVGVSDRNPLPRLPGWKVTLLKDDSAQVSYMVTVIREVLKFKKKKAQANAKEVKKKGRSFLITVHKEKAEHIQQQFRERSLATEIEPS